MRKSWVTLTASLFLVLSSPANAESVDIVASAHGSSCAEAQDALREVINGADEAYSSEQADTRQFPNIAAAKAYCRDKAGAAAPYVEPPEVLDTQFFHLPTEVYESAHYPCSYVTNSSGVRSYGVGWMGTGSCFSIADE